MPENGSFIWIMFIYIAGIIAILYFLSVRPGKKKNQKMREMHDSIEAGDEVNTIGGLYGTVTKREKDDIYLLVDEKTGTTIKVVIYAISGIVKKGPGKN